MQTVGVVRPEGTEPLHPMSDLRQMLLGWPPNMVNNEDADPARLK
jgi:hypothetical protein